MQISDDLAENYEQLREERGCTWEQLAKEHETHDERIAAYFRERSANEDGGKSDAPKGRRAAKKSSAAPKGRRAAKKAQAAPEPKKQPTAPEAPAAPEEPDNAGPES